MANLTVLGLPAHPLVVHALVVGIPLVALGCVVMLARARWRRAWAWPLAVAAVGLFLVSFVATSTGEGLQQALGGQVAQEHSENGELVPWFAGGLAVAAVAFAVVRTRGRQLSRVVGALLVVTAVAAVVWVAVTGHSGAEATWGFVEIG